MTPAAAEAASIVSRIRVQEQQKLWAPELENAFAKTSNSSYIFPGMQFTLAKKRIESSKLWAIVRRMPKGALLHCHLEAMVDVGLTLEEALDLPEVHIRSDLSLATVESRDAANILFDFCFDSNHENLSIWSPDYNPHTLVPLCDAAKTFPENGHAGFIKWVKSKCTITLDESLRHHQGPDEIWRKFTSSFIVISSLIYYEPLFRSYVWQMCQQLMDDGVKYVDVRAAFHATFRRKGHRAVDPDHVEHIKILRDEIERFKMSPEGKGFWGARLIWTTLRHCKTEEVISSKGKYHH